MKLKIATELKLGLALGFAVVIGVAALGWRMMDDYAEDTHAFYHDHLAGTVQLAEAESALWRLRYAFPQFMTGDAAERQAILAEEAKWLALIEERLAAYGAPEQQRGADERQALAELRAGLARYLAARPKFFELWQAGRLPEARDWRAMTTTPYGAATLRAFERQIDLQHRAGKAAQAGAEADLRQARKLAWVMVTALLAIVGGGYWLGRRVLMPVATLVADAETTVRQVLGEELGARRGNELDMLVESMSLMRAKLVAHATALETATVELTEQRGLLEETVAARTAALHLALENAERQTHETSLRNEMGELLQSCLSLDEVNVVTARFVQTLFPDAAGTLYLAGSSHVTLEEVAAWNRPPEAALPVLFDFDDCWGLRRAKPYLTTDTADAMLCPHLTGCCHRGAASLCVPLAAQGEVLGLLHLGFSGFSAAALDDGETPERHLRVDLAASMAAQIALAVSNLRLRDALRQQSIRDALTGLYNRRFIEETLPRELARAVRAASPLAVFMLDVDHFKRFNDTQGHDAGDAVLRALGRVLRDSARDGDLPCRFGGEEFTIVLVGATREAACEWAERLMQKVRHLEVKAGGQMLPAVTVSLGLAMFPGNGSDRETLLLAADLALYDAKHAGRDRLAVSGEEA